MDDDELTPECFECGLPRSLSVDWCVDIEGRYLLTERWRCSDTTHYMEDRVYESGGIGIYTYQAVKAGIADGSVEIVELWEDA